MIEVTIPSPGESVTEVTIDTWHKADGDIVQKDEPLADIQSDKAMLTLYAETAGKLSIKVQAGETVAVGTVACTIDESAAGGGSNGAAPAAAAPQQQDAAVTAKDTSKDAPKEAAQPQAAPQAAPAASSSGSKESYATGVPSASAAKLMAEQGIAPDQVQGTGRDGRITKTDVVQQGAQAKAAPAAQPSQPAQPAQPAQAAKAPAAAPAFTGERSVQAAKMTQLRKTVAARLVSAKNETAMLTTFNEVDMTAILELRKKYKESFQKAHDINLGFMSFFAKACAEALRDFPLVGGQIHGDEIHTFNYVDMGIAVSTDRGLMVPVVRNVHALSLADIEKEIARMADKARTNKITLDDMQGGNFTITNGGVFGSLLSTPILNPPQSAILGMHKTQERPVALNGQVVIRPMMYLALSYDHRIIDGKEAVSFLVRVKEYLEDPARMLLQV